MKFLILISVLFSISFNCNAIDIDECWKDYYPRSVNSIHDEGNRDCGVGGFYAAGLCYPPCAPGEVRQPTGWCKKPSGVLYISGTPFQPKCNPVLEEQAGLCYPRCKQSYKGIGVLCWSDCSVHPVYKADCGMYCGKNQPYCDARNLNIILTLGTSVASVVTNPTVNTGLQQANNIVSQIAGHKICSV